MSQNIPLNPLFSFFLAFFLFLATFIVTLVQVQVLHQVHKVIYICIIHKLSDRMFIDIQSFYCQSHVGSEPTIAPYIVDTHKSSKSVHRSWSLLAEFGFGYGYNNLSASSSNAPVANCSIVAHIPKSQRIQRVQL